MTSSCHWEPKPILNEVIPAQVQSLAGAISATTDSGSALSRVSALQQFVRYPR
jgi:hypothetical protein